LSKKTRTYFAFRVDIWDTTGDNMVEHVVGLDDFEIAEATYRVAVARWPAARISRASPLSYCSVAVGRNLILAA
jgi:hypothetical protein